MADTGATSPGTMASASTGTAWSNPNNAKVSDGVYATCTGQARVSTQYLIASNFGFSIPSGATINGVVAEIQRYADGANSNDCADLSVYLTKDAAAFTGSNQSAAASWSASPAYVTFGSSSNVWGATLSDSDVNASGFGVIFRGSLDPARQRAGNSTAYVDHIRLTVYYTESAGSMLSQTYYAMLMQGAS